MVCYARPIEGFGALEFESLSCRYCDTSRFRSVQLLMQKMVPLLESVGLLVGEQTASRRQPRDEKLNP